MEQLRGRLNDFRGNNAQERTWRDDMSDEFKESCPTLSYENRLYAFIICMVLGVILSIVGLIFVYTGNITLFAVYYSLGSILGLLASTFLVGPLRQVKTMFSSNRWIASLIYLGAIAVTVFVAVCPGINVRVLLILLCLIIQYCAAVWYGLSFIPYARTVLKQLVSNTCCEGIC